MENCTNGIEFVLNGEKCTIGKDESLMKYLREKKNITSVKNGCNQGACGACMILVDGKAVKACLLKGIKVENKEIATI